MSVIDNELSAKKELANKIFIENITSNIKGGLGAISDGAKSLASKATLTYKTVFDSKGLSKPATSLGKNDSPTPQDKRNSNKFVGGFVYPATVKYYTVFSFKAYQRVTVDDVPISKSSVSIVLPIPSNLAESFGVNYVTPALGPIVNAATDSVINKAREFQSDGIGSLAFGYDDAAKLVTNSGSAVVAVGAIKLAGLAGVTAENVVKKATGVVPNPGLAVLFSDIGLREHTFSYKFAPNSIEELRTLKRVIKELKKRMLPGLTQGSDMLFTFPDTCNIEFGPNKNLPFKIKECVMKSMSVNYAPNGPAFFNTGDAVMVELSMTFMEIRPYTRRDVEDKEDNEDLSSTAF